jgi:endonuclease/exonuclease/phosphatase family metal-dependent hydrolase
MIIGNTWFKQHSRRLATWNSPDKITRNQIDYILINERFRSALLSTKAMPGADCNSDHQLLCGKIRIKLKKISRKMKNI